MAGAFVAGGMLAWAFETNAHAATTAVIILALMGWAFAFGYLWKTL